MPLKERRFWLNPVCEDPSDLCKNAQILTEFNSLQLAWWELAGGISLGTSAGGISLEQIVHVSGYWTAVGRKDPLWRGTEQNLYPENHL